MVRDEYLAQDILQYVFLQCTVRSPHYEQAGQSKHGYARWLGTAVSMNSVASGLSHSVRSLRYQIGKNFPLFSCFLIQIHSRKSCLNCRRYGNDSERQLNSCPHAIAGSCCSDIAIIKAFTRLGRPLVCQLQQQKRTFTGQKNCCACSWNRSLRASETEAFHLASFGVVRRLRPGWREGYDGSGSSRRASNQGTEQRISCTACLTLFITLHMYY